jgi:hypothetical protein
VTALTQIEEFTRALLTHQGALVDRDAAGLSAMIPAPLATTLGVQEYQRLIFEPHAEVKDGLRVDYDSPLVERLGQVVDQLGRVGWMTVPPLPLKDIDAGETVARALVVSNGVVRNCRAQSAEALYVCFFVEYALLADERVSGLLELWVNATMRSLPRLEGLLARATQTSPAASPAASAGLVLSAPAGHGLIPAVRQAWSLAAPAAEGLARQRLSETIESLGRRRDRDLARLRDYYAGIDHEVRRRARRALAKQDTEGARAEASRLEATAHAYRSRVADLVDRHRVRVRLSPLGAVACTLTVHQVTARLHRRSASRDVRLAWNPLDRALEAPCCDGCGRGATTVTLCDDQVHLLCTRCTAACETCGKPFCRACHTTCPRRHDHSRRPPCGACLRGGS